MQELIKELEKLHRACEAEETRYAQQIDDALDMKMESLADAYQILRHYHLGKKKAFADVLETLEQL